MRHPSLGSCVAAGACLSLAAACASTRAADGGALEPRFVAVHNALAALGLAQVGPIREGVLAQGGEARVPLDLPAGCTTVVALGGDGIRDLDARLADAQGHPVAHDTTAEPQAVLRACVDAAGPYVLVLRASSGAGSWVAATWEGVAAAPAAGAAPTAGAQQAMGTCDAPIPLSPGTVSGSTSHGEDSNAGSCERSTAREIVYELDVPQRERVVLEVDARFDSVLYLRKDSCSDDGAEVDCNDDAPNGGRNRSRIERVLDPGKYFVFVDGYNQESGSYKLTVTTTPVLSLNDECRHAQTIALGATVRGSTAGGTDDAQASCGGGAHGTDAAWRFELPSRARVRVSEHADGMSPVVHLRHACADEQSEIACGEFSGSAPRDASLAAMLEIGSYTAFADASDENESGPYTLALETSSPAGDGAAGDGCGDAVPLGAPGNVSGDTFAARDDVAGSCGGAGAPDVVYRLDVARRSRLSARLEAEEAPHLLVAWRRCGDRSAELACGRFVDTVVAPGTYFLGVDGDSRDAFGRFTLVWSMQDLTAQTGACTAAPALVEGRTTTASTSGAGDRFAVSCAGGGDAGTTGPDRVFRFTLASGAKVRVSAVASAFDAALALRTECEDGPAAAEIACEASPAAGRRMTIERSLEPGTYWAVVDGQSPGDQGAFTIDYRRLGPR